VLSVFLYPELWNEGEVSRQELSFLATDLHRFLKMVVGLSVFISKLVDHRSPVSRHPSVFGPIHSFRRSAAEWEGAVLLPEQSTGSREQSG